MSLWTLLQARPDPYLRGARRDTRLRRRTRPTRRRRRRRRSQAGLLVFNAAAILNEKRFLERRACRCWVWNSSALEAARRAPGSTRVTRFADRPPPAPRPCADGWGFSQLGGHQPGEGPGALKHQIIGTLHAATYMRVPLVAANVVVALLKLIIG
jgi:hypothetical protein